MLRYHQAVRVPLPFPAILLALLVSLLTLASVPATAQQTTQAQRLLDQNRPQEALELLDRHLSKSKKDASAFLLRSSAHFMLGARDSGVADLERALKLNDSLRQGWLNLGALNLSDENFPGAIEAFQRAADLNPTAPDNDLNLGTAQLLAGSIDDAHRHFGRYLQSNPNADAYYLVATNFAVAQRDDMAIEHLERAIRLDEKTRLRIRSDPTFRRLEQNERLSTALVTDSYRAPEGSAYITQAYSTPYETSEGTMLKAVVDSLTELKIPFSPRIEVTAGWSLLWIGREPQMRLKISTRDAQSSLLEVIGPVQDQGAFRAKMKPLLDSVGYRLTR